MPFASVIFDKQTLQALNHHAIRDFPFECCGVLIGDITVDRAFRVRRVLPAANIAEGDRRRSYQLDWSTLLRVSKQTRDADRSILGFYHSHPDGSSAPSRYDLAEAWDDTIYVIVPVVDGVPERPTGWIKPDIENRFRSVSIPSPHVDTAHSVSYPDRSGSVKSIACRGAPIHRATENRHGTDV